MPRAEADSGATFAWRETATMVADLWRAHGDDLQPDPARRGFTARDGAVRVVLPAVQPLPPNCSGPRAYLEALPDHLGAHLVVLLQAGAAALGWWTGEELLRHKVFKRYVVRGNGRAQPAHLKSKGKSRYGSRLRLQNAQKLLAEVNQRQRDWITDDGPPDLAFYGCAVRLWADLQRADPGLPLAAAAYDKIALDVRVPGFDELRRVRRALLRGRVVRTP